jgi:hypothetical protein
MITLTIILPIAQKDRTPTIILPLDGEERGERVREEK